MTLKVLEFSIALYWWVRFFQACKERNCSKQIEYGIWFLTMLMVGLR